MSPECLAQLKRAEELYADCADSGTRYTKQRNGGFQVYVDLHDPKTRVRVKSALARNRFSTQREASQAVLDYLSTPFAQGRRWKVTPYASPSKGVKRERE
tara:strand:- start:633 stop:932 length:300 start_codon:yes stop_codon:yes gene_type:complete